MQDFSISSALAMEIDQSMLNTDSIVDHIRRLWRSC